MTAGKQRYLSFLLRLWQVKRNGEVNWCASLDDSHTGERRYFASLAALTDFLKEQTHEGHDEDQSNLAQAEKQT